MAEQATMLLLLGEPHILWKNPIWSVRDRDVFYSADDMSWQTWAPCQSAEVREICAHMSATERADTVTRGAMYGAWCAVTLAIPSALVSAGYIFYGRSIPIWMCVLAGGLVVIHVVLIPRWRRAQLRFLRNTQWARQQRLGTPGVA